MFELSSKTQVDKKFTMRELFKAMSADKSVKADAENISHIVLRNVLSEQTMNFTAKGDVKEIYFFELELKTRAIPALFISSLDKVVELHTVFILKFESEHMYYGAYKEYSERGMKVGRYYGTQWSAIDAPIALPLLANSLDDVYMAIVETLIPIDAREGEQTNDFVARYDRINKLKVDIAKKQKQVDTERQSKRRFELNDELKELKKELENYE